MKSDWRERYGEQHWGRAARASASASHLRRLSRRLEPLIDSAARAGGSRFESLARGTAIVVLLVVLAWSVFIERMDGQPASLVAFALARSAPIRWLIAASVVVELGAPAFLYFERTRRGAAIVIAVDLLVTSWLFDVMRPGSVLGRLDPTGLLMNTALVGMCLLIYADRRRSGPLATVRSRTTLRDSVGWR